MTSAPLPVSGGASRRRRNAALSGPERGRTSKLAQGAGWTWALTASSVSKRDRRPPGTVDQAKVHEAADRERAAFARAVYEALTAWRDDWTLGAIEAVLAHTPAAAPDLLDPSHPLSPIAPQVAKADPGDAQQHLADVLGRIISASSEAVHLGVNLTITNPRAVAAASRRSSQFIVQIGEDARQTIRTIIANGQAGVLDGRWPVTPQGMARQIRDTVGLTDRQGRAVVNYRRALDKAAAGGSPADALGYKLRDPRLAVRSGLTPAQIDKAVEAYAERYLRYRAMTIARTETMWAANRGILESWAAAVEEGLLDGAAVKVWFASDDERTCPTCGDELDGERVPLGEDFSNGADGPPDHPDCRCTMTIDDSAEVEANEAAFIAANAVMV